MDGHALKCRVPAGGHDARAFLFLHLRPNFAKQIDPGKPDALLNSNSALLLELRQFLG